VVLNGDVWVWAAKSSLRRDVSVDSMNKSTRIFSMLSDVVDMNCDLDVKGGRV
jgi:hypothetical protein